MKMNEFKVTQVMGLTMMRGDVSAVIKNDGRKALGAEILCSGRKKRHYASLIVLLEKVEK